MSVRYDWSVRARMTLLSSVVMALLYAGVCALILVSTHNDVLNDRTNRILVAELRVARHISRDQVPPCSSTMGSPPSRWWTSEAGSCRRTGGCSANREWPPSSHRGRACEQTRSSATCRVFRHVHDRHSHTGVRGWR